MNGLFFTGTDTGVGKTHVTAAVGRLLRRQGRLLAVAKPVVTGAHWTGNQWLGDDTVRLAEAVGSKDFQGITPWAFSEPAAPPIAARQQGVVLVLEEIIAAVRRQAPPGGLLLVEGVGGLLCPLTDQETVAELALGLGLPLVVVARKGLGTLNHTLLTLEAAARRKLAVAGVVVNEAVSEEGLAARTNVEELRRRIAVPLLAVVPNGTGQESSDALAGVDWWQLATVSDAS